jgi:hypothetical protein
MGGLTTFFFKSDDTNELWSLVKDGSGGDGELKRTMLPITSDTTAGWCFLQGAHLSVPNLQLDGRFSHHPPASSEEQQSFSVTCLPIKGSVEHIRAESHEESFATLGVVEVVSQKPLDQKSMKLLQVRL